MADIATTSLKIKSLESPDEIRRFTDKGQVEIVELEDVTVGRVSMEPGWKWSEHVKPIAGTESCQSAHTGYVLSGVIKSRLARAERFASIEKMLQQWLTH